MQNDKRMLIPKSHATKPVPRKNDMEIVSTNCIANVHAKGIFSTSQPADLVPQWAFLLSRSEGSVFAVLSGMVRAKKGVHVEERKRHEVGGHGPQFEANLAESHLIDGEFFF
jgi:hypothetical protein